MGEAKQKALAAARAEAMVRQAHHEEAEPAIVAEPQGQAAPYGWRVPMAAPQPRPRPTLRARLAQGHAFLEAHCSESAMLAALGPTGGLTPHDRHGRLRR